jgi:Ala-tRNA(Pro) deacylase
MHVPSRLEAYLAAHLAGYDLCTHRKSRSSPETARAARLDAHQLAKAVVLEDEDGSCLMALLPADRPHLHLADKARLAKLFADCAPGTVPAFGMAWGLETVVDDELSEPDAVYLECGDHEALVRLTRTQFAELMHGARHAHFCDRRLH